MSECTCSCHEELELDYSDMEERAKVKIPSGVNWKVASKPKTYAELFDVQYELDSDEEG